MPVIVPKIEPPAKGATLDSLSSELQASFDRFNGKWMKNAELQVEELKKNSKMMQSLLQSLDMAFSRNTEAVLTFTQAMPKELRRNSEVMAIFSEALPKMLDVMLVCAGGTGGPRISLV
jgi:hypothetical protein